MADVAHPQHHDPSLDQQLALRTAATRLHGEFDGTFDTETIERFLHSSHDRFASHRTSPDLLPLQAERFARQRLRALAKVEGHHDGTPTVLFLCVHNAGRSQMAMGFFQYLAGNQALAWSGGSEPGHEAADVVITMGCGDTCPVFPGKRYLDWELDDPAGRSVEDVRRVRDEIERRVRGLLAELGVPALA